MTKESDELADALFETYLDERGMTQEQLRALARASAKQAWNDGAMSVMDDSWDLALHLQSNPYREGAPE